MISKRTGGAKRAEYPIQTILSGDIERGNWMAKSLGAVFETSGLIGPACATFFKIGNSNVGEMIGGIRSGACYPKLPDVTAGETA